MVFIFIVTQPTLNRLALGAIFSFILLIFAGTEDVEDGDTGFAATGTVFCVERRLV